MLRKVLLFLSLAFIVVCYGIPCVILPLGTYETTIGSGDSAVTFEMKFDFKGNVKTKSSESEEWSSMFYKLKGQTVIISSDKEFDDSDMKMSIENMYEVNYPIVGSLKNDIGFYIAIGVGILDLLLIATIPSKKD
jgi:hypothetical protein